MNVKVERLVICLRWAWHWKGFWNGWLKEAKVVPLLAWTGLAVVVGALMQVVITAAYPVWRLLIEPVIVAIRIDEKAANNLKKIIDS